MPPTLGVHLLPGAGDPASGVVETFVPGMVMTFDRNRDPQRPPDVLFRRLYGLTFAHTVRREVRPCASCHADPVALGFGAGALRYETDGRGGRWRFTPRQPPSKHDGLPEDAWTGFLQPRTGMVSARDDVRPLAVDEQRRILRVGACLACHGADSPVMKEAVSGFDAERSFLTLVRAHRRRWRRHLLFRLWWLQFVLFGSVLARRLALRLRPAVAYGVGGVSEVIEDLIATAQIVGRAG